MKKYIDKICKYAMLLHTYKVYAYITKYKERRERLSNAFFSLKLITSEKEVSSLIINRGVMYE